jgi:hypothetical protein
MNIIVLTLVRLLGDDLVACFSRRPDMQVVAVVNDLTSLRAALATTRPEVAHAGGRAGAGAENV